MTTQPISLRRHTSLQEALQAMAAAGVSALPVLARGGHLCGIVSEADRVVDLADPAESRATGPKGPSTGRTVPTRGTLTSEVR